MLKQLSISINFLLNPTMNTLKTFFVFGKYLSLTPSYDHPVTQFQKICTCLLAAANFILSLVSIYSTLTDSQYYFFEKVLFFLTHVILIIFTCYTPLSMIFWNQENWQKLMANLIFIVSLSNDVSKIVDWHFGCNFLV